MKFIASLLVCFTIVSCKKEAMNDTSTTKVDVQLPEPAMSKIPAEVVNEVTQAIVALENAQSKAFNKNGVIAPAKVEVRCEPKFDDDVKANANHCRINYSGPHIRVELKRFLFDMAAGELHIARKIDGAIIWLRAFDSDQENGLRTLEICRIEGVETGIGISMGGETWAPGYPNIEGLKIVLKNVAATGKKPQYRTVDAMVDVSYSGGYPNDNCLLASELKAGSR